MKTRKRKSQLDNPSIMKLERLPYGWVWNESAGGPSGWCWASNGKSRFKPGFMHALVKIPA
jgi:hypothetical protein